MPDLLIELFSEEIPARMQTRAAADLKRLVTDGLVEAGLTYAGAEGFATPRRLALAVEGLSPESPTRREERKGPRTDAPRKALEGFLRSTGLKETDLVARDAGKGEVWFATIETPGRPAAEIVAEVLAATIRTFPWPKSMRWGAGTLRWVRPLHHILCILSENGETEIVDLEIDGIRATDKTPGHRFMAPALLQVRDFEDYAAKLRRAHVVLSSDERAEAIRHDAAQAAFAQGLEVVEDAGLLAEVAGLVEWPVTLMGEIGEAFLDLPPEVLRTSMKEHQKFFSVRDRSGRIVRFVTVANRETADDGATILAGNQKVLSARLADAKFFWENDLRIATDSAMQPWLDQLENVTFHARLGSQAERIGRIAMLSQKVAPAVGADPDRAGTAARIAKADLSSEMVYEFPELQGVMGEYYARAAGHPDEVAAVARAHYQPLGPSDDVPDAPLSVAVALADKIDTLTCFWAIDEKPTGSKDPYALRRAALGVIRLVLDNGIRIDLGRPLAAAYDLAVHSVLNAALPAYADQTDSNLFVNEIQSSTRWTDGPQTVDILTEKLRTVASGEKAHAFNTFAGALLDASGATRDHLVSFIHDRLKVFLRDRGIRHDVIDACLAMPGADDLTLLVRRAEALQDFLATEDGENLVMGFRRAHNILVQAEDADGVEYSFGPDPKLAETDEERALFTALDAAEARIAPAMADEDFATAMSALAGLRQPIDAFFDAVQVNAESAVLRRNRLNLLHRISTACRAVADLTRIETG